MPKRLAITGAAVVAALGVVASATAADTYRLSSTLTAKVETPAPKGAAAGRGLFTALVTVTSKTGGRMAWRLSFSQLTGGAVAAHVHLGKAGQAGAVLVPLCGPCRSGQTGSTAISAKVLTAIKLGRAYVNVHTKANPSGEIRGQLGASGATGPVKSQSAGATSTTVPAAAGASANGAKTTLTAAQVKAGLGAWKLAGCAGCHTLAAGGGQGTRGPNLDAMWFPVADIVRQVTNGGGYMPAFKGVLTPAQIAAVADWVASVRKATPPK